MTPQQFIAKWQASKLSERSACHEHFLDLCRLLGQPTPAESDPDGAWYTFERGVHKLEGDQGWADVWMQDHFAQKQTPLFENSKTQSSAAHNCASDMRPLNPSFVASKPLCRLEHSN
jgi:hypothetical protein